MQKNLSLLIKPASGTCNLRCKYCFYHDVTENRQQKNYGMMEEDVLDTIVQKAYDYADGMVTFAFQGGEPMLRGLDYFKKLIEYTNKYNANKIKTGYAIQTNGTLIDENWASFFKENNFLVGLSMDGYRDIHDLNRVDANGKGTFKIVKEASVILNRYNVDYNILCVVTKPIAKHGAKVYNYFKSAGFKYLQFIPCLDDFGDEQGRRPYSLTAEDYGRFLINIFDLWYKDIINNDYVSIRMFDNLIRMIKGYPPESCDMVGQCAKGTVIESDGSLYPCDFYVLDEWCIGSVMESGFEDLISNTKMDEFVETSKKIDRNCKDCEFYFLCRSGCRRHKHLDENQNALINIFCKSYKIFYAHASNILVEIARNIT